MKALRAFVRLWFCLAVAGQGGLVFGQSQPARPNVLLVMADQWRGSALSFGPNHDANVQTPHLESLASQGIRFDRCYATDPLCTPNRSTLITGRYPSQNHMVDNDLMLPPDIPCMADVFKDAGYSNYYCGKFHIDGAAKPGFLPQTWRRRGYEVFEGFNRGHEYFNTSVIYTDGGQVISIPTNTPGGTLDQKLANYEPHRETDLAMAFIRTNQNRPWFAHLSWGPPHTPYTPPSPFDTYTAKTLSARPNNPSCLYSNDIAHYYGSCAALDYELGRLVQFIDDLGLGSKTLIIFTSDHGDLLGSHGMQFKHHPEEESLRVPLLMRWTGTIPAGQSSDFLFSTADMMPTLLGLAGLEIPSSCAGTDKSAVALGRTLTETPVFGSHDNGDGRGGWWRCVVKRTQGKTYKLVMEMTNSVYRPTKFWSLTDDPYELNNLSDQSAYASVQSELQANVLGWQQAIGDPWPAKNVTKAMQMYSDLPGTVLPVTIALQKKADGSGVVRAQSQSRVKFKLQQAAALQPPGWFDVGEVRSGNGNALNFPVSVLGPQAPAFFRVQQSVNSTTTNGTSTNAVSGSTYFVQGGDIAGNTTNDWDNGAPTAENIGLINTNIVSGFMRDNLTNTAIQQLGGTISITDGSAANRAFTGTHGNANYYLLAGGVFQRNNNSAFRLGNSQEDAIVVFEVNGGLLKLTTSGNSLTFWGTDSRLEMTSGTVDCGANSIILHASGAHTDTPFLAFTESGQGAVTCGSLSVAANVMGYIDFEEGSTGTLTVKGAITYNGTNTTYQGLWDLGRLRFQGVNDGSFADIFQVVGNTLLLR